MKDVLTPSQSRNADQALIQQYGISGEVLMERAAQGVVQAINARFQDSARILILCGPGNNGGDGFAVLRQLHEAGRRADCWFSANAEKLSSDALAHYHRALQAGCRFLPTLPNPAEYACVVDALFGTGLSRPLSPAYCEVISKVNACAAYRISVDIPSGIDGLTGRCCGAAIRADETVTFQYVKRGLLLCPGREYAGKIQIHPIAEQYPVSSDTSWLEASDIRSILPPRPLDSHKGKNGRALLCVGSERYTGAALLSARAALRGGCGLLSVAVPAAVKPAFSVVPEAMCVPCGNTGSWDEAAQSDACERIDASQAVGIGCGMGEMSMHRLLRAVIASHRPAVVDADALNQLAAYPELLAQLHPNVVLTPHPAEMARLLRCSVGDVLENPIETARESADKMGCIVLLKGATTCISNGSKTALNTTGNPGLAKGGSGDVLTGLLLALLSQRIPPFQAACAAAFLLGASADLAYQILGNRMLIAGDVIDAISQEIRAERVH